MRRILGCLAVILGAGCGGGGGGGGGGEGGDGSGGGGVRQVETAASLMAAPLFADCGAPAIDGVLSPGEWDRAVAVRFAAYLPESAGGGFVPAEVRSMSDDENLYVAFRILRNTAAFAQSHTVHIDANEDGFASAGDDGFLLSFSAGGDLLFADDHISDCIVDGSPAFCYPSDLHPVSGPAGTNDGGAMYRFGPDETVVEEWHPYTGKDPLDVLREVGQSVDMSFSIRLVAVGEGPEVIADTEFPPSGPGVQERYRPFVLGCNAPQPEQEVVEVRIGDAASAALPTIRLGSSDPVVATVLGSARLDASRIDPASVFLAGAPVSLKADGTHAAAFRDVDADGLVDLVAEFPVSGLQLSSGVGEASLAGRTVDGQRFHGTDAVQVTGP